MTPLLQTKDEVPFDRAVDRTVEALFQLFLTSNRASDFLPTRSAIVTDSSIVWDMTHVAQNAF